MEFIAIELFAFAAHAARHFRPAIIFPIGKTLLHELKRFDIIWCRKTTRTIEGKESVQSTSPRALAFFNGTKRPSCDLHLIHAIGDRRCVS